MSTRQIFSLTQACIEITPSRGASCQYSMCANMGEAELVSSVYVPTVDYFVRKELEGVQGRGKQCIRMEMKSRTLPTLRTTSKHRGNVV
jgi:hypothetical protein